MTELLSQNELMALVTDLHDELRALRAIEAAARRAYHAEQAFNRIAAADILGINDQGDLDTASSELDQAMAELGQLLNLT